MILAAGNGTALWYITRASGVVSLLLLTAGLVLGILGTVRWRSDRWPRFAVVSIHRNLTLFAIAFVALHVVTTIADGYAPVGFKDAVIPFVSKYRPLWLGFGAVAFDLLLALVVTSLLRARIGFRAWRAVHWLAYASWPFALVHGLGNGSDARFGWLVIVTILCAGSVG
ncbi:MAG: ferric reductase, partial [Actinobacteria bacterium]